MTTGIPASVTAQAERSELLINQLNEAPQDKDKDDNSVATSEKSDVAENTSEADDAQAPAKEEDAQKEATQAATPADDGFQAKYLSLQGKYNAEIPRLHESVRTLQQQVDTLIAENTRLKSFAGDQTTNQNHQNDDKRIDPDALDEYGPEFKEMAAQLNRLAEENSQLKQQLGSVEKSVGDVQQAQGKTAYEKYISQVAKDVKEAGGDLAKLNSNPDFLSWLKVIHPLTGKPRHALLQEAERQLDVSRTLAIFKTYLDSLSPPAQKQKNSPSPKRTNIQPNQASSNMEVDPSNANKGKIWTAAEISKLYADKSAGLFRGKDAEFKALELDMFKAQEEGRVQR